MAASAKDQPAYAGKHVLRWLRAHARTRDHVALSHEVVDGGGDGPLRQLPQFAERFLRVRDVRCRRPPFLELTHAGLFGERAKFRRVAVPQRVTQFVERQRVPTISVESDERTRPIFERLEETAEVARKEVIQGHSTPKVAGSYACSTR